MQVDPTQPTLKPPGTMRLKLVCDVPPFTFAFKCNLRRYTKLADIAKHRVDELVSRVERTG